MPRQLSSRSLNHVEDNAEMELSYVLASLVVWVDGGTLGRESL